MQPAKLDKRVVGLDLRQAMAKWVAAHEPERVVLESTGIYGQSPGAFQSRFEVRCLRGGDERAIVAIADQNLQTAILLNTDRRTTGARPPTSKPYRLHAMLFAA